MPLAFDPPVLINVHNRVNALRQLVAWLERAGHQRITLLDNASTYEPLLEYLEASPHKVVYLGENVGARSLWATGRVPDEWFVFTDPDIVPIERCPLDAVAHFKDLLDRYPAPKAGFGLFLNDVPQHMPSFGHERSLMNPDAQYETGVYRSAIDTTFALYRPGIGFEYLALRTGFPYMARHQCRSWYGGPITDEDRHYLTHARKDFNGSSWAKREATPA